MKRQYDIAIIGSGFAGSLMAMIASRLGHSVILFERGTHPRVVIGESSTPLANLLLEELAARYDLPSLVPLTKWGSWQRTYPQLACGLKRGFSFFHHELNQPQLFDNHEDRQLLVAASPHDEIADTHWFRADFDHFLVTQAMEVGVDYCDKVALHTCTRRNDHWRLAGNNAQGIFETNASFLIDATGPRGFLHQTLGLREARLPSLPATCALYSHFSGVHPLQSTGLWPATDAPYPIDAAAVHHVFDGGWIWVLNFNNGWTSAGIAATHEIAGRYQLVDGEQGWHRLLEALPIVQQQFSQAQRLTAFKYIPRLSFLSDTVTGDGWAMLPTAAGFVDPLLSTGIPLTLLGIGRLARVLGRNWESPHLQTALDQYAEETLGEFSMTAQMIGSLYRNMEDFSTFRMISLLYFAAASYSETARRLDKYHLAEAFLLHNHPAFGPECLRILKQADTRLDANSKSVLAQSILNLIGEFDVAGLSKQPGNHCYPVQAADLIQSAYKVGATSKEIEILLERSGFLARQGG